jgi:hypothetical protein
MAHEYVKQYYGFQVEPGDRVRMIDAEAKEGVAVRKRSYDQYVHVRFDGTKFDVPVHPMELENLSLKEN